MGGLKAKGNVLQFADSLAPVGLRCENGTMGESHV